jgi:hypothetical protein
VNDTIGIGINRVITAADISLCVGVDEVGGANSGDVFAMDDGKGVEGRKPTAPHPPVTPAPTAPIPNDVDPVEERGCRRRIAAAAVAALVRIDDDDE